MNLWSKVKHKKNGTVHATYLGDGGSCFTLCSSEEMMNLTYYTSAEMDEPITCKNCLKGINAEIKRYEKYKKGDWLKK